LFVIDSDDLPPIDEPDTYYDHQLQGLRVKNGGGAGLSAVVAEVAAHRRPASCWRSKA